MTKQMALKLWDDIFDKALWAQDCYGTWVYRNDYGDHETTRKRPGGSEKKYNYGWEVDHIKPKSSFKDESDADLFTTIRESP